MIVKESEVPLEFRIRVTQILGTECMGDQVGAKEWGKTSLGQYYVLVTSSVIWYAVRLLFDEDHPDLELSYQICDGNVVDCSSYLFRKKAAAAVQHIHRELAKDAIPFCRAHRVRKLPPDIHLNPDKYLKPGDHIARRVTMSLIERLPHGNHEGIYLGNGKVCHISNGRATNDSSVSVSSKSQAYARIDRFEKFLAYEHQQVVVFIHCLRRLSREDICKNAREYAEKRYGEGKYDFFGNNCQHFAWLCATGIHPKDVRNLEKFELKFL